MQARTRVHRFLAALLLLVVFAPARIEAYSVLTHEQVIDLVWQDSIVPLLLSQYPNLTSRQLDIAHSYSYGGCAIQDLGYYPFSHDLFSDLTHYVRSGDFIRSLFRNAHNANELAFAIGALSHYLGDSIGHSDAINPAVAVEFPDLGSRFGRSVNYAEGKHQHIQTEFAFDVNQIAKRHFAPLSYLQHVGLRIPRPLLDRAFFDTYGLTTRSIIGARRPTINSYRFGARSFIPHIAYAETLLHRKSFLPDTPGPALDTYLAEQKAAATGEDWAAYHKKPGIRTRLIAFFIVIAPKVGVLRDLSLHGPSTLTEQLYIDSINRTTTSLRRLLSQFDTIEARIPNRDLDTGQRVRPGGYPLTDITFARLLGRITRDPQTIIPTTLQRDLLDYYADSAAPILTKKKKSQWARVQSELKILATMPTRRDPPVPDIGSPDDVAADFAAPVLP